MFQHVQISYKKVMNVLCGLMSHCVLWSNVSLCHMAWCHILPHGLMSHCVFWSNILSCHMTQCHISLTAWCHIVYMARCHIVPYTLMLCHMAWCHIVPYMAWCHIVPYSLMSHFVIWPDATLCTVAWCHIVSYCLMSHCVLNSCVTFCFALFKSVEVVRSPIDYWCMFVIVSLFDLK